MSKTYNDFIEALGMRESSGDYMKVNKTFHYLGKYQLGEGALIDTGYYKDDGKQDNKFSDKFWTGKDGVHSKDDYLKNHQAQENAVRAYMAVNWKYIKIKNLDLYVGKTIKGFFITVSGILAGAHLGGHGKLTTFLKQGIALRDGNKVPITEYIEIFAGYETPFTARKRLTGIKKDKNTMMYQIDNKEWISKEIAINMIKLLELDGVVVSCKNGNSYIKTRPDNNLMNNLKELG